MMAPYPSDNTRPVLGVVEGFYGVFYTFPERNSLIQFIGTHGFKDYLYAPKNDRQQRLRWWEAYPDKIMQQFANTISAARQSGVNFIYGISPGQTISYSSSKDFQRLTAKLAAFLEHGVCSFALLLDDTEPIFRNEDDRKSYPFLASAQADFANRVYDWLLSQDASGRLSFCPVDYFGTAPFCESLHQLSTELMPGIDIFYTGPDVCNDRISEKDILDFAHAVGRAPILWDNFPVNDLSMSPELHLGPLRGRSPEIRSTVRGVYANLMIQPEAVKIPLLTYAAWMQSEAYDAAKAWDRAVRLVAGVECTESLRLFCQHAVHSSLDPAQLPVLENMVSAVLHDLKNGVAYDTSAAIKMLETHLNALDNACYNVKFRLDNLALRQDLLSWIELLEHWIWMIRRSLSVVCLIQAGQDPTPALASALEYRRLIQHHHRRVPLDALMPIIDFTIKLIEKQKCYPPRLTLSGLTGMVSSEPAASEGTV
jgi:hyaluronoglucosaminidase